MINNYMQNVLRDRQLMIDKMRNQTFGNNIQIPEPITMQGLLNEQVLENTNNTPEIIQEEAPVDVKATESRKYPLPYQQALALGGGILEGFDWFNLLPQDFKDSYNFDGTDTFKQVGNIGGMILSPGKYLKLGQLGLRGLKGLGGLLSQYGRKAI